ncbi:MAG: vesicular-fusion protein S17 [Geoglossum simile]|nr:MAG: vesicular-fusion protein S17 [Geoglossum simile]
MSEDPRVLLSKAEKAVQGATGGWGFFGRGEEKWEKAVELFKQAASGFRRADQGKEAGQAFERAAYFQRNSLKEPDDAANTLMDAFKCYRMSEPSDAARVIREAINHYETKSNFRRAATLLENLGELCEKELNNNKEAIKAYETGAKYYRDDLAEALANKLYLKVADISALEGDFLKAVETYGLVARSSLKNNLMMWSVKEYLLKSGICLLAAYILAPKERVDLFYIQRSLQEYCDLDHSFASTREHQLLADLIKAVEDGDQEEFANKLYKYDLLSKLDKWKTTILLRVKNGMEEKGEDFS